MKKQQKKEFQNKTWNNNISMSPTKMDTTSTCLNQQSPKIYQTLSQLLKLQNSKLMKILNRSTLEGRSSSDLMSMEI